MNFKKYLPLKVVIPAFLVVVLVCGYLLLRPDPEMTKVVKNLNSQNWDMAIAKLKEMIYDDENNLNAKGLLFYAQTRKYCEENNIKTSKKAMEYFFKNLAAIHQLVFLNKLNESNYLNNTDRENFLRDSKELRKQLAQYSIPTENMQDVEQLLEKVCKMGVDQFKISFGDEIDQTLYAMLLAGNSFFGDKESGEKLVKLAKANEDIQPLFLICGEDFAETLRKEAKNDQSLISDYAKYVVIKSLLKEELSGIFANHGKLQSATVNLEDSKSQINLYCQFKNNQIFFDNVTFDKYLEILEKNMKAGIDVSINLNDNNNIIALYGYDPVSKKYFTKFYSFMENELLPIEFAGNGSKKDEFYYADSPIRVHSYDKKNNHIILATDKVVTKQGFKTESRYNSQKYYSSYYGFYGGYEYVEVPYEYQDVESMYQAYSLNKNKANYVGESSDINKFSFVSENNQ